MNKPIFNPINNVDKVETNLKEWLENQVKDYHLKYLLAHADDGVIWGRFEADGTLITQTEPEDLFPKYHFPKLRWLTLQQCRIFCENSEVMLWKVGQNWKARSIEDRHLSKDDYIPENQILWGTQVEKESNGFTLVSDGSQGLRHAVPLINIPFSRNKKNLHRPIRLVVRHYFDYDDSGVARIYLSRLVDLRGTKDDC